jgi:hypothetical protein
MRIGFWVFFAACSVINWRNVVLTRHVYQSRPALIFFCIVNNFYIWYEQCPQFAFDSGLDCLSKSVVMKFPETKMVVVRVNTRIGVIKQWTERQSVRWHCSLQACSVTAETSSAVTRLLPLWDYSAADYKSSEYQKAFRHIALLVLCTYDNLLTVNSRTSIETMAGTFTVLWNSYIVVKRACVWPHTGSVCTVYH